MLWLYGLLARARRLAGHPHGPLPPEQFDYRLARDLHRLVVEVRRMPVWEVAGWVALYAADREEAERAAARRR